VTAAPPRRVWPAADLTFRPATTDDVDDVVALVESAYWGDASRAGWTTEADLLDGQRTDAAQVTELIRRSGSMVLLGHRDGELVACCHLERRTSRAAYFGMFAVQPARQGGGVGRAVLAEARRQAAAWGCETMRMTVIRQRRDLIDWYERFGYLPTGETEPFPYGDERFGRPRRADLEFVVLAGAVP
jgi:GNAT superfamily N-acetyltransferase